VGPLPLKGKDRSVDVLELVGFEPEVEPVLPGAQPPMVGRDREVAVLRTLYERASSEARPHLVTVYGEAGVGKSRLARELATWTARTGPPAAVAVGRCLPYGEGVTYWPLAEILKRESGVLDSDPPELALDKIRMLTYGLLSPTSRRTGPGPRRRSASAWGWPIHGRISTTSSRAGFEPRLSTRGAPSAPRCP